MAYYAWVEEHDATLFARIRQRVEEGRWELAGGWWVEPDCNLPGGRGARSAGTLRAALPAVAVRTTWPALGMNVDPFGHPGTLPQILAKQGLESYVFFRPLVQEMALPASLFRWRSPDGK